MRSTFGRHLAEILMIGAFLLAMVGNSQADSQDDYDRGGLGVKGIFFMPDLKSDGLNGAELFICGYRRPWSLELALGGYSSKTDNDLYNSFDVGYVSLTARLYAPLGPVRFYAGCGEGLYYANFRSDIEGVKSVSGVDTGFSLVGGAEVLIGKVSLRGEVRWVWADFNLSDDAGKLHAGGIMANVGIGFF